MSVRVVDDAAAEVAQALQETVRNVLVRQPRCVLACAGGSTPVAVFAALGGALDDVFDRLTVTLVDERHLGGAERWEDLPAESNTRMLHAEWLSTRPLAPTLIGWAREGTLEEVRAQLDAEVPEPDVLLLGIGPDGHIASLFPGHALLGATGRVLSLSDSPKPPPERLTMSMPLLRGAQVALILITGSGKAEAAQRCLSGEPGLPTTHLSQPGGPVVRWTLDPAAAEHLENPHE